jgi:hypothetical protein
LQASGRHADFFLDFALGTVQWFFVRFQDTGWEFEQFQASGMAVLAHKPDFPTCTYW